MNTQKGSAHVAIIIGLVVLLLGALGFIFWQNFIKQNAKPQSVEMVKSKEPKKAKDPVVNTDKGFIVLKGWGVKFKIPDDVGEVTYYSRSEPQDESGVETTYEFSTRAVEALGDNCVEGNGSVTRLAYIGRTKTKPEQYASATIANQSPIDGYYYMVSGAQATCSDKQYELQEQSVRAVSDMLLHPIDMTP